MLSDKFSMYLSDGTSLGLNPCSNGICSLTQQMKIKQLTMASLNPCSNGICSLTRKFTELHSSKYTSLNPCSNGICSLTPIAIILWDGMPLVGLNPCSNGICSLTLYTDEQKSLIVKLVLILVLMEYAL